MEITCQRCGASADVERLEAVPGGFGFTCGACTHVNVLAPVAAPAPAPAGPAPATPPPAPRALQPGEVECPKCGHGQRDPEACHRCGLVFARARDGRFDGDPLAGHPAAEAIRQRWEALSADLDDAEGHHAFIRMCAEADLLEYAGQCYRRLGRGAAAEEDARVASYRQRVMQAALARMGRVERKAVAGDKRLRNLVLLTLAALILLGFAVGYYLLARHQAGMQLNG